MQNRRDFLKQSTLLTAAAVFPALSFASEREKLKLGLQLYTIREAIEKNLFGTLHQLAGFGYQEVETYSFNYGKNKYYWGLEPKTAKQLLDDCNLKTSAGHYDLDKFFEVNQVDDLKRYVDECIVGAHVLKQNYIVWPWLAPKYRTIDEFKRLSATLNTIGEQIKKSGLQLAYHNHDFEFINHNGQMGYDIILNETDKNLVKLEMDLFWVSFASPIKPHVWFEKQPDRFVLWHVKDMDKNNQDLHVPVGDGKIDFKPIFKDQKLAGVKHIFVEQGNNYIPNDLVCVKKSAIYVKNNLL